MECWRLRSLGIAHATLQAAALGRTTTGEYGHAIPKDTLSCWVVRMDRQVEVNRYSRFKGQWKPCPNHANPSLEPSMLTLLMCLRSSEPHSRDFARSSRLRHLRPRCHQLRLASLSVGRPRARVLWRERQALLVLSGKRHDRGAMAQLLGGLQHQQRDNSLSVRQAAVW